MKEGQLAQVRQIVMEENRMKNAIESSVKQKRSTMQEILMAKKTAQVIATPTGEHIACAK